MKVKGNNVKLPEEFRDIFLKKNSIYCKQPLEADWHVLTSVLSKIYIQV